MQSWRTFLFHQEVGEPIQSCGSVNVPMQKEFHGHGDWRRHQVSSTRLGFYIHLAQGFRYPQGQIMAEPWGRARLGSVVGCMRLCILTHMAPGSSFWYGGKPNLHSGQVQSLRACGWRSSIGKGSHGLFSMRLSNILPPTILPNKTFLGIQAFCGVLNYCLPGPRRVRT